MVTIIFFPSGRTHLTNQPPRPPVHICPLLPDPPSPLMCGHPLWMAPVHDRQLIQAMYFLLRVYYMGLCTGRSRKEATVRFFRRAL